MFLAGSAMPTWTVRRPSSNSRKSAAVLQVLELNKIIAPNQGVGQVSQTQEADELRMILAILQAVTGVAAGRPAPLGPVNGALGETIGPLLNGKKSVIGIRSALFVRHQPRGRTI
jgi:hypothetical protein